MFDFKHIKGFDRSYIQQPGPMVVLSTPGKFLTAREIPCGPKNYRFGEDLLRNEIIDTYHWKTKWLKGIFNILRLIFMLSL